MADDTNETENKVHAPWAGAKDDAATTSDRNLTTGGLGSGAVSNDTGGLDAAGNEMGAVDPGTSQGKTEGEREDESIADAKRRG